MTEGATGAVAERTGIYEHVREIKYYMAAFIFVDRGHDLFKNLAKTPKIGHQTCLITMLKIRKKVVKMAKNRPFLATFCVQFRRE